MDKSSKYIFDSLDSVYEVQVEADAIAEREWQSYCKSHLENLKRICKEMAATSAYCKHELEVWGEPEYADALAETAFSTDSGD